MGGAVKDFPNPSVLEQLWTPISTTLCTRDKAHKKVAGPWSCDGMAGNLWWIIGGSSPTVLHLPSRLPTAEFGALSSDSKVDVNIGVKFSKRLS